MQTVWKYNASSDVLAQLPAGSTSWMMYRSRCQNKVCVLRNPRSERSSYSQRVVTEQVKRSKTRNDQLVRTWSLDGKSSIGNLARPSDLPSSFPEFGSPLATTSPFPLLSVSTPATIKPILRLFRPFHQHLSGIECRRYSHYFPDQPWTSHFHIGYALPSTVDLPDLIKT